MESKAERFMMYSIGSVMILTGITMVMFMVYLISTWI